MMKYSKKEAIRIIVQCAERYHSELEGNNLLFMCCNKHKQIIPIEVSFDKSNYLHLTGIKPPYEDKKDRNLYANDFYKKCLEHKLSPSDFEFSKDGTTFLKLEVLSGLICKNLCANIIGDYNSSKPYLYIEKIIGNIHACM